MNREEVLKELVEMLDVWPTTVNRNDRCGWSWKVCRGVIQYRHDNYTSITEQDWLDVPRRVVVPSTPKQDVTREQALQFLVDRVTNWPLSANGTNFPMGWSWLVIRDSIVLSHPAHKNITKQDWTNTKQVKRLKDADLHDVAFEVDQLQNINRPCVDSTSPEGWKYVPYIVRFLGDTPNYQVHQPKPPSIPDGAERMTFVKGELVYLKHYKHKVLQFKNGEWVNDLKLDEAVKLWDSATPLTKPPTVPNDAVHQPKHYSVLDGVESIQIIASSMTRDEWRGFCMGNIMKYRMRAGKKDALQQDIDKSNEYEMLFEMYKELNRAKR